MFRDEAKKNYQTRTKIPNAAHNPQLEHSTKMANPTFSSQKKEPSFFFSLKKKGNRVDGEDQEGPYLDSLPRRRQRAGGRRLPEKGTRRAPARGGRSRGGRRPVARRLAGGGSVGNGAGGRVGGFEKKRPFGFIYSGQTGGRENKGRSIARARGRATRPRRPATRVCEQIRMRRRRIELRERVMDGEKSNAPCRAARVSLGGPSIYLYGTLGFVSWKILDRRENYNLICCILLCIILTLVGIFIGYIGDRNLEYKINILSYIFRILSLSLEFLLDSIISNRMYSNTYPYAYEL
uniref:Uncharacterized protein n=1 Tax=Oryza brachyantha TaxID=4533 RepID=J3L2J8_ORYBR